MLETPNTIRVHDCCASDRHLLEEGVPHAHVVSRIPARAAVLGVSRRSGGHPGHLALRTLFARSRLLAHSKTHLSMSHKASALGSVLYVLPPRKGFLQLCYSGWK